ncbi:MAG: HDOD domain-containing protein [Alphaproteobacteria bacterium]|nr:HDOD domain-containing protein [Alphaproteobacteria bacterium]
MADAVRRVLELLDHPEPPLDRAGAAIEADPALAASVLSLANSAYHGIPRRVVSVRDAAVFLGGRSLRLAVLTAWVFDRFEVSAAGLRDRAAERLSIARHLGAISDEAATAALLLDVGSLLLLERHRAWLQSTARLEVGAQRAADTERLGLDRDLLGAHLLARWRLPSAVVAGVGQGRTSFPDPSAGLGPHAVCWLAEAVRLHLQGAPEPDPGWVRTMGLHHRVAELLEMAESRVRAS